MTTEDVRPTEPVGGASTRNRGLTASTPNLHPFSNPSSSARTPFTAPKSTQERPVRHTSARPLFPDAYCYRDRKVTGSVSQVGTAFPLTRPGWKRVSAMASRAATSSSGCTPRTTRIWAVEPVGRTTNWP